MRVFHHVLLKYGHENAEMEKQKFDDVTLWDSIEVVRMTEPTVTLNFLQRIIIL